MVTESEQKLLKIRVAPPFRPRLSLTIMFGEGISKEGELIRITGG